MQAEMEKIRTEVDERDSVILEMKGRLECEQTDQVIYEKKIKGYENDLERIRSQAQTLLKSNNELAYENEETKRTDRDLHLRNELLQNQV